MPAWEEPAVPESEVVAAAQAGDQAAVDKLLQTYLPLVYNLIGRASEGSTDVNELTSQTMRIALDGLPVLNGPQRFRPWLLGLAAEPDRPAPTGRHAPTSPDFAEVTIRRLALTGQRREAVIATRWLSDDDRTVLSLWWLEVAGKVTRVELAEAGGLAPAQATDRVRQVEERLLHARSVVRALDASPRCPELAVLASHWDGHPSARAGKRLARHVAGCPTCLPHTTDLIATDRLLRGLPLVPLPAGLEEQVRTAPAAVAPGRERSSRRAVGGPAAALVISAILLAGGAVWYANRGSDQPVPSAAVHQLPASPSAAVTSPASSPTGAPTTRPAAAAVSPSAERPTASRTRTPEPSATPAAPFLSNHSLRSVAYPTRYIRAIDGLAFLDTVSASSPESDRRDATFRIVVGLADSDCYSFRDQDGRYLRHYAFRVRVASDDGSEIFNKDVTFCVRHGPATGSIFLQSYNYPDRFLRYRNDSTLWIDPEEQSSAYRSSASFLADAPLA